MRSRIVTDISHDPNGYELFSVSTYVLNGEINVTRVRTSSTLIVCTGRYSDNGVQSPP